MHAKRQLARRCVGEATGETTARKEVARHSGRMSKAYVLAGAAVGVILGSLTLHSSSLAVAALSVAAVASAVAFVLVGRTALAFAAPLLTATVSLLAVSVWSGDNSSQAEIVRAPQDVPVEAGAVVSVPEQDRPVEAVDPQLSENVPDGEPEPAADQVFTEETAERENEAAAKNEELFAGLSACPELEPVFTQTGFPARGVTYVGTDAAELFVDEIGEYRLAAPPERFSGPDSAETLDIFALYESEAASVNVIATIFETSDEAAEFWAAAAQVYVCPLDQSFAIESEPPAPVDDLVAGWTVESPFDLTGYWAGGNVVVQTFSENPAAAVETLVAMSRSVAANLS